jgi:hypothetical protein
VREALDGERLSKDQSAAIEQALGELHEPAGWEIGLRKSQRFCLKRSSTLINLPSAFPGVFTHLRKTRST